MTDPALISFGAAVTFTAFCGFYVYMRNGAKAGDLNRERMLERAADQRRPPASVARVASPHRHYR